MTASLVTSDPVLAADTLRAGHLAVLPTETVYGLGALAVRPDAVARVYAVKGRPADHPLIVHLAYADLLDGWAKDVPGYAQRLAERLWPGPLTLVLPRGERAGDHVTGGQGTVGLRIPDHPLTLQVLDLVGDGVAAPSANPFGRVSPTTAEHVRTELGARLVPGADVILDGGPCRVGVESTILDCTGPAPIVLRPGGIDVEQITSVGGVAVGHTASAVRAPGTLTSHYSPRARVVLVTANDLGAERGADAAARPGVGVLAMATIPTPEGMVRLSAPETGAQYASVLYAALREADALGLSRILAVAPDGSGVARAVRDRLARAAH
jgi:L-threonylcarbamoyladenylate synthase